MKLILPSSIFFLFFSPFMRNIVHRPYCVLKNYITNSVQRIFCGRNHKTGILACPHKISKNFESPHKSFTYVSARKIALVLYQIVKESILLRELSNMAYSILIHYRKTSGKFLYCVKLTNAYSLLFCTMYHSIFLDLIGKLQSMYCVSC